MLETTCQLVLRKLVLLASKTLRSSTFVSGLGYLDRIFIMALGAQKVGTEAREALSKNDDDQQCIDEKEDNGLLETY